MTTIKADDPVAVTRAALAAALADQTAVDLSWIQPPPTANGWTLAPDALRFLTRLVGHLRPRHILEFGSGLSTQVLARAAAAAGTSCRISSVDHDPEFGRPAVGPPRVRHQLAPVVARDCGGKLLPVYLFRPGRFASRRSPDLVLIDGPPITLGGREGTLYQVLDFARAGTLVLLDDADRVSERLAVAHWLDNLGDTIDVTRLPGFTKGMVAIVVRTPVRRGELWTRKLDLTRQQIEATVPAGQKFVLIEGDYWAGSLAEHRRAVPLVERAGESWGPPLDDEQAIHELNCQQQAGARQVVFLWPSFWWLEYYQGFTQHLRSRGRCVVENDRLVVFELSPGQAEPRAST